MTFDAVELSIFGGEPANLFRFRRGSLVWRYSTGGRPFALGLETFEAPGGISRSAIQDSSERAKNRLTIRMPVDLEVVANWAPFPTSQVVLVDCLCVHRGTAEAAVEWTGRVVVPKFYDTEIELVCEPTRSVNKARSYNFRWQRGCGVPVYSQGIGMCNLDPLAYAVAGIVSAVAGLEVRAPEFAAAADLAGGALVWPRPDGEIEHRTILAHLGDTVFIDYGTDALPEGNVVEALPGCAHTWDACAAYGNTDNYPGVLTIPRRSPHDGNPVQ